jgi:hypothetical protein
MAVIFQRDKARPHKSRLTLETMAKDDWDVLPYSLHSLNLAPKYCHLFGALKHLRTMKQSRKTCIKG